MFIGGGGPPAAGRGEAHTSPGLHLYHIVLYYIILYYIVL